MRRDDMTVSDIKQRFEKDVANHTMKIVHQDGVYRTIECRQIGSVNYSFTIVTTPYYLAYMGDMGTYVFSRNTALDMLDFFRKTNRGEEIPYGYWKGKLEAGEYKQFDAQTAVTEAMEMLEQEESINFASCDYKSLDEIKEFLEYSAEDGEHEYFTVLSDLMDELEIDDWYETCKRVYKPTFHYIWCCYAILWAIAQYVSMTNKAETNEQV